MKIIKKVDEASKAVRKRKEKGKSVGFVPTMGALHEGHLSLIRRARSENGFVVVSIFVNPAQFGPKEDLKRYPKPVKNDISLCKKEGVDLIFYPEVKQMYPEGYKTYIEVKELSDLLCGKPRPGHFKGVATVVTKLFNIIQPDTAYFGQKDGQQAAVIKKMASDLNMPVKIKVMPIVREKDGLAMSSRNVYLSTKERKDAVVLFNSLNLAKVLIKNGQMNTDTIILRMKQLIGKKKSAKIDYIDIVDPNTLKRIPKIKGSCFIVLAVWIGKTRLIDNIIIRHA